MGCKDTLLQVVSKQKIRLAPPVLSDCFILLQKFLIRKTKYKYVYSFDKKAYKNKPFILLGDHASRNIYSYTICGTPDVKMNTVLGFHNLFSRIAFMTLLPLAVIPKNLYEQDLVALKKMLWVIRHGGRLCFFPEGIQSVSGSTMPMNPGTISFLKRAGVDVLLCKSYGAYLCSPRYREDMAEGPQEFHYEVLFTSDELKSKSEEELYEKYKKHFYYNNFEWNKKQRNSYVFKEGQAKGIGNLLYHCPGCHREFGIYGDGNDIICKYCGNKILLNEYYDLIPYDGSVCDFSSIDDWFKYQRKVVRAEVGNEEFHITYEAELRTLHYDRFYPDQEYTIGCGTVTISPEGIGYVGTKFEEQVDILFEIKQIPSFTFTPGKDNDIYYRGEYLLFRPLQDRMRTVKYMLYVEELHNLTDKKWNRVSRDVYGD